jgi:hypothetical protein
MVHRYHRRHHHKYRPNFLYGSYNPYYGYPYFGHYGIYSPYPVRDPYYTYMDAMHYARPMVPPRRRFVAPPKVIVAKQPTQNQNAPWWVWGAAAVAALFAVSLIRKQ